ncbi:hypothetical protein Tco_1288422 [Tanacetum coccineum]
MLFSFIAKFSWFSKSIKLKVVLCTLKLVDIAKLGNLKMLSLSLCMLDNIEMITSSSMFQLKLLPKLQELDLNFKKCKVELNMTMNIIFSSRAVLKMLQIEPLAGVLELLEIMQFRSPDTIIKHSEADDILGTRRSVD